MVRSLPHPSAFAQIDAKRRFHAAIDAALMLFTEDRQRDMLRVPWVECAVRLARGTPERLILRHVEDSNHTW